MATKPTAKPKIAFDTVNLPNAGTTNKMQPRLTWQNTGFDLRDNATAQEFNWLFSNNYDWISYFEEKTDDLQTEVDTLQNESLDYETRISTIENAPYQSLSQVQALIQAAKQELYPVDHILISWNSANPNTYLGFGTWTAVAQGRFIAGVGSGTDINAVGHTVNLGNESSVGEYEHTLTEAEMPSHDHGLDVSIQATDNAGSGSSYRGVTDIDGSNPESHTDTTGGGNAHNNIPPYTGMYIWRRTA